MCTLWLYWYNAVEIFFSFISFGFECALAPRPFLSSTSSPTINDGVSLTFSALLRFSFVQIHYPIFFALKCGSNEILVSYFCRSVCVIFFASKCLSRSLCEQLSTLINRKSFLEFLLSFCLSSDWNLCTNIESEREIRNKFIRFVSEEREREWWVHNVAPKIVITRKMCVKAWASLFDSSTVCRASSDTSNVCSICCGKRIECSVRLCGTLLFIYRNGSLAA